MFVGVKDFRFRIDANVHSEEATRPAKHFSNGIREEVFTGIPAIFSKQRPVLEPWIEKVAVFHFNQLQQVPKFALCGMYRSRWYGRMVAPSNELSFGSGHCLSHDWFEKEEGYFCPLAERCEAYSRKWSSEEPEKEGKSR